MHILQMVPALAVGGVERGVLDLAKALTARGHRMSVVSSGGPLVEELVALGARHYRLPVDRKSPGSMWSCVPAVARLIRDTDIDVVHARSRVPGWIGWAAARRAQRPFVTTAHGFYAPGWGSRVMVWGRLVIAPSEAMGRYLMDRFGLERARLRIIPRGVDLDAFALQPPSGAAAGLAEPWRIGLVGRLSSIKGHEIALRATARLIRQGLPVKLCIAGDTPDHPRRRALVALAHTLKIDDSVEWLGLRHDVPALLASMDVVIVPAVYPESFGRAVVEAQAVGRAVVASRIGAFDELIRDGETGLLVPPGDDEALARGVERLCADAPLRARCVRDARADVETHWSLERMAERTLEVYEECVRRPRVVIWKMSALGDVLLATPSLRAVRRTLPEAHLSLIVGRGAYELVARCPYLDEILVYDPRGKDRGWRGRWAFIRRLARARYDHSLDLQNSRQTHLMAWLAGIPIRSGFRRRFGWLLNRPVSLPRVVLAPIAHQHYLLERAGFRPDGERLELWPSPSDDETAARLLGAPAAATRPTVALHPGGSGRWKTKRWPLERWAQLCDRLAAEGVRVVITGGAGEQDVGRALSAMTASKPLVTIGRTSLLELACLFRRCGAVVVHDSSPLHVAAAVGTPAVALFGPTDPARHLPPSFRGRVLRHRVFCSPCYSPRCRTFTHACMRGISVEEAAEAVLASLDPARTPGAP
ncbi:MAG TPA: glycosyltransferase family 9 protein [bacterium]